MNALPVPQELPLLIGRNPDADPVIGRILEAGQTSLENLCDLSSYFDITLQFSSLVTVGTRRRRKTDTEHCFKRLFLGNRTGQLAYATRRGAHSGYVMPGASMIKAWKPSRSSRKSPEFRDYEQFKKRFDPMFISEKEIQKLWAGKSAQHGGKYNRGDFRSVSPKGRSAVKEFMKYFKGVEHGGGLGYRDSNFGDYQVLNVRRYAYASTGRDISVSHQTNLPYVFYSSEYSGTGNGRYGLLVNKSTYLWLEDD